VPRVLCLAVGNAAGWDRGVEQGLGSCSPFLSSVYMAKQAVGAALMLPPVFFQIYYILRRGKKSKILPGRKDIILEWDDTHTQNKENPLPLNCQNIILRKGK